MHADLIKVLAGRDLGAGYVVLHLDETTGQRRFETIDLDLKRELADSLGARMAAFAYATGESVIVQFPITKRNLARDSLAVPFEECPPALRNQPTVSRLLGQAGQRLQSSGARFLDRRLETRVWIFVTERGRAIAAVLKQSSGEPLYDRAVRVVALRMEFHPALFNRVPAPVWVDFPIRLSMPAHTPRNLRLSSGRSGTAHRFLSW